MDEPANEPMSFEDTLAWRRVLTGLRLIYAALLAVPISLVVTGFLTYSFGYEVWLAPTAVGVYAMGLPIVSLVGLCICWQATPAPRPRRYAQSAFVLAAVAVALANVAWAWVYHMNQGLMTYPVYARYTNIFAIGAVEIWLLDAMLAVLCWHWYLAALANHFHDPILAGHTKTFGRFVAILNVTIGMLIVLATMDFDSPLMFLAVAGTLLVSTGMFAVGVSELCQINLFHDLIRRALEPPTKKPGERHDT